MKIDKKMKFLNEEYKEQKNNLKLQKEDYQKYLLELNRIKKELNDKNNEINKKKISINKRIFHSFSKKNSLIEKETNEEIIKKPIMKKSLSANKTNISINKSEFEINQISNINTTNRKNFVSFSSNRNNSLIKSKSPKINKKKLFDFDINLND